MTSDVMATTRLVIAFTSDVMPMTSLVIASTSDVMPVTSLVMTLSSFVHGFLGHIRGPLILSYMEAAVSDQVLAACAEFPNDNPRLHGGAIWVCRDVTGEAEAEVRALVPVVALALPVFVPASPESAPLPGLPPTGVEGRGLLDEQEAPTDPTPPVLEAEDETDDIEIVEELAFEDAIDESPVPPEVPVSEVVLAAEPEPVVGAEDPFVTLARVVEDVARASGADATAMATLGCILGRTRLDPEAPATTQTLRAQALAWQGVLCGESEDFAACGGGMLDEWCAALVAGVMGQATRADGVKRELRKRGVAAFGLVEQAA